MPPEKQKKTMAVDRYVELFKRYDFDKMTFILGRLKTKQQTKGEILREELETKLQEVNNKIQ